MTFYYAHNKKTVILEYRGGFFYLPRRLDLIYFIEGLSKSNEILTPIISVGIKYN